MRRSVTVLAVTAAALAAYTGIAAADADISVELPVEQQVLRVENTPRGAAVGSPGIISGNVIQIPVQVPINLCGNSIDIIGLLNSTNGNTCVNS